MTLLILISMLIALSFYSKFGETLLILQRPVQMSSSPKDSSQKESTCLLMCSFCPGPLGWAAPMTKIRCLLWFLFIYLWLHWVFVAVHGLPLLVASRGYSSLRCTGFSLQWLLLLQSTGSRSASFSSCGMQAQ